MNYYWSDYAKPKYGDITKLCYTDINRFIVHLKSEDIHADLVEDVYPQLFRIFLLSIVHNMAVLGA